MSRGWPFGGHQSHSDMGICAANGDACPSPILEGKVPLEGSTPCASS